MSLQLFKLLRKYVQSIYVDVGIDPQQAHAVGFDVLKSIARCDVLWVDSVDDLVKKHRFATHVIITECDVTPEARLVTSSELIKTLGTLFISGLVGNKYIFVSLLHRHWPPTFLQDLHHCLHDNNIHDDSLPLPKKSFRPKSISSLKSSLSQRLRNMNEAQRSRYFHTNIHFDTEMNDMKNEELFSMPSPGVIQEIVIEETNEDENVNFVTRFVPSSAPRITRHQRALTFADPVSKLSTQCAKYLNKVLYLDELMASQQQRMKFSFMN